MSTHRFALLLIGSLGWILFTTCKQRALNKVKGLYEDQSPQYAWETTPFRFHKPSESLETSAVILADSLFEKNSPLFIKTRNGTLPAVELAQAIVAAQADLWIYTDISSDDEARDKYQAWGLPANKIRFFRSSQAAGKMVRLGRSLLQGYLGNVFIRDYAPIFVKNISPARDTSEGIVALDFNYFSFNQSKPWALQDNYIHDDAAVGQFARDLGVTRHSLPIFFEGGNLISNSGGDCFLTDAVLRFNGAYDHMRPTGSFRSYHEMRLQLEAEYRDETPSDRTLHPDSRLEMVSADYLAQSKQKKGLISAMFKKYFGCQSVTYIDHDPYLTAFSHIDMWARFIDDQTVLLAEIPQSTLSQWQNKMPLQTYKFAQRAQQFLNEQAERIFNDRFTVIRIPIPLPYLREKQFITPTFLNFLEVNQTIIIPRYGSLPGFSTLYLDSDQFPNYQHRINELFSRISGWQKKKIVWIDADAVIQQFGAIHCITSNVPNLD